MAGNLGTAYVQIVPSAKGISGKIKESLDGEAGSAGEHAGGLFGGNMIGKIKGLVAAAGIGKLLKDSIMEGAKLEQSFGGLDTLYGDAAGSMKEYAMSAAQAGISANNYAEQAVSFGAALRGAFGGDMVAAAEAANIAIMDMADNSAKMGTDIGSIQNAYQGFAKQNYTMLDNLKLGYGGTKAEMQRLLSDAEKLSGVKYDINNLGDVYSAIHVIQEDLGLTGVAADEAATTISGSFNAVKASASDLLAALSLGMDIGPAMENLVTSAVNFVRDNLIPAVLNIVKALPGAAMQLIQALIPSDLQGTISGIVSQVSTFIRERLPELVRTGVEMLKGFINGMVTGLPAAIRFAIEMVSEIGSAIMDAAPEILAAGIDLVMSLLEGIVEALPEVLAAGVELVLNIVQGIAESLPDIAAAAVELVDNLLTYIVENGPQLISSGINLVINLIQGLLQALPDIAAAAVELVAGLYTTLWEHAPDLLANGIELVAQLVAGLIEAIPDVVDAALEIGTDIWNTIKETDWLGLGTAIIVGIVEGIKNAASTLYESLKELAKKALDAAKKELGINSPSKVFRDVIGVGIDEGIAVGVTRNTGMVTGAIRQMSREAVGSFLDSMDFGLDGVGDYESAPRVQVVQNIYSEAKTASDLMVEARYHAELGVMGAV